MLILEAKIRFFKKNEHEDALNNDLSTHNRIIPAINFGNNILYSAYITFDSNIENVIRGEEYLVLIESLVFDVEHESGYKNLKNFLKKGRQFSLQVGRRIIGEGLIIDYQYSNN